MKEILTFQQFLKSVIYLMLVGQLWVNVISYCHWMIDSSSDLLELCKSEKSESEEEIDKEEKDDNLRINLDKLQSDDSMLRIRTSSSEDLLSIHYLEITLPPPKPFYFLS